MTGIMPVYSSQVLGAFFMAKDKPKSIILERKQAAFNYLKDKRTAWDDYERLFHNQLQNKITDETRSHVFDPKLSTLILERAYRVMSQNPTGKVRAISKNDLGAERLMNMVLDKYILPNANAQFDFLTKARMTNIYSNLYGNFFTLVDWDIKSNGYIGPDMWMIPIRDVFPQVGAMSLEDSEYIIIRTWQPISFFESKRKDKEYKNIDKIITELKKQSNPIKDSQDRSQRTSDEYPQTEGSPGKGYYEVLTMYERDKWTDYCVGADMEFREIDNPHKNGELPIVCKYSIPLIDDFMGMGDAERGQTMQHTVNSIWNLYLDAVKMSIFPPLLLNKDMIASMSSIKMAPGAKWLIRGNVGNTAQLLNLNPQGISTFNNTYQVANASLLNMFGTTDTTITSQTEAGFGKTPEALKMQGARENIRDNADRYYTEEFIKKVINKMVNLFAKKNDGNVAIRMFKDEVEKLAEDYEDVAEMYDEDSGKLTISTDKIGKIMYDYEIVSGSTYLVDQEAQQKNLSMLMTMFTQQPEIIQMLAQFGYRVNLGELFKRIMVNSGIQDWDKIIEQEKPEDMTNRILDEGTQQFVQAVQQMTSNGVPVQGGQGV